MATGNRDFVDLSATINARTASNNNTAKHGASSSRVLPINTANENVDPEVRNLVADETLVVQRALEERMKDMVQGEMDQIKRSIAELSKVVKELSMTRTQGQDSVDLRSNNRVANLEANNVFISHNLPVNNSTGTEFNTRGDEQILAGNSHRNAEKASIRVDKWGIIFDGNNTHMSVEDFIFRIEYLQSHYDISWDEILRDFHLLVTGAARDWYWLLIRTHGALKWPTLKNEMRNQYRTNISNFEIMRDLVERKQRHNESLDTFFFEMSKLRSRLMQPIPEYDMIKILKRNVRENVARIVYPISVSSVEQLRMECQEAERNFPGKEVRGNFPQQRFTRNVSEVHYENIELEPDLEEVAAAKVETQKQNLICWNCRVPGHGFRDCNASERTLFCYRCGKPNTIAPKCPDCLRGNQSGGVGATGDLRPTKNPNQKPF